MIPLKDDNPRTAFPIINTLLIIANVLVFVHQISLPQSAGQALIDTYGAIPQIILQGEKMESLLSSMFLHGGFFHLFGNMLYLFIFGDNVENLLGSLRYLFFYALCGVGAALAHIMTQPDSAIPMVGASGAISGILGAYAVSFPRARVLVLLPVIFIATFRVPAYLVLGQWFVLQLFAGVSTLGATEGGGVAWFAHIGGFVIGIILLRFFKPKKRYSDYSDIEIFYR
ncbi:MAG: rhomboid family intramembrane serine protease [candidate division KSB1 bacterium]|nr:rhomboid family intramembrane serine protease [candidate division KSB1 bacterium]MDZ7273453.1 rhomboid family intramembrane serine protease [candidate division KSB1 bacterium]MDZ7286955.1 rhomboid family intramembrane serine protease [candidate division KSB1 bacterium]MDZ7299692.1 rhomboid family intramembrane serine protease [candidate division KSB1 bacterium]MDZ7308710.1 rhomboid family intramembrane serine protease [candidate division KSB1 bacterium]